MPIDPCFSELLSDPRNTVRPPPAHVPMDKVRRAANSAMSQGDAPEMASVTDGAVPAGAHSVPVRHYRPNSADRLPLLLFCHGGGFVWGSIDTHDGVCRRLAAATGAAVVSVDYRLSPETPFPGPVEDVRAALHWVIAHADVIGIDADAVALCGDSAGGGICVSVAALAARAGLPLRHIGLFYPALDPACGTPSQREFADGPLLTRSAMEWFWRCYLGAGDAARTVPLPGDIQDFSGFPPTTIATAEFDPLRDEGKAFHDRLRAAGVDAHYTCCPGMIHGFLSLPATSPGTEAAFTGMCERLRTALFPRSATR